MRKYTTLPSTEDTKATRQEREAEIIKIFSNSDNSIDTIRALTKNKEDFALIISLTKEEKIDINSAIHIEAQRPQAFLYFAAIEMEANDIEKIIRFTQLRPAPNFCNPIGKLIAKNLKAYTINNYGAIRFTNEKTSHSFEVLLKAVTQSNDQDRPSIIDKSTWDKTLAFYPSRHLVSVESNNVATTPPSTTTTPQSTPKEKNHNGCILI